MYALRNKNVLVLGLGASGQAASRLLQARGARVTALDEADTPALQRQAAELRGSDIEIRLSADSIPAGHYDLAVLSPGVPPGSKLVCDTVQREIPIIAELELGFQQ